MPVSRDQKPKHVSRELVSSLSTRYTEEENSRIVSRSSTASRSSSDFKIPEAIASTTINQMPRINEDDDRSGRNYHKRLLELNEENLKDGNIRFDWKINGSNYNFINVMRIGISDWSLQKCVIRLDGHG